MNVLCNLSRKKSREVAASLPGRFLSRRCFTLCIRMKIEPIIAKQYKCQHCCSCKNYRGKGMECGKKCLCVVFRLTRRSRVRGKKIVLGHPIARETSYCFSPLPPCCLPMLFPSSPYPPPPPPTHTHTLPWVPPPSSLPCLPLSPRPL